MSRFPFIDVTNSSDGEFRVLLITLCLTRRKNTEGFLNYQLM